MCLIISFYLVVYFCRKPDLIVDPENVKTREPATESETTVAPTGDATAVDLDNRFGADAKVHKCGVQLFMPRIVGGEICELDEFPWAALLLYESSKLFIIKSSVFN